MTPKFMKSFRGVVYHLPRHKMQNFKRTYVGYHQLEGHWDRFIPGTENKLASAIMLKIVDRTHLRSGVPMINSMDM